MRSLYIHARRKITYILLRDTCLKIYLYKTALFIFVNNVRFFSMLYHGAVEYVANIHEFVYT